MHKAGRKFLQCLSRHTTHGQDFLSFYHFYAFSSLDRSRGRNVSRDTDGDILDPGTDKHSAWKKKRMSMTGEYRRDRSEERVPSYCFSISYITHENEMFFFSGDKAF